jgi:hypothetical protein
MVASGAFFDLLGLVVVVTMIGYIAGCIEPLNCARGLRRYTTSSVKASSVIACPQ